MGRFRARPKTWFPGKYRAPTRDKTGRYAVVPVPPTPPRVIEPRTYTIPVFKKFSDLVNRRVK